MSSNNSRGVVDDGFWRGRRVLVTGHTGFKGSWLALRLAQSGAHIHGYSLPPPTTPSLYQAAGVDRVLAGNRFDDVRDAKALDAFIRAARPEVVFHLAAQSLVRAGYRDPITSFSINVMGTAHVLDAVRRTGGARVVLVTTTDKVYRHGATPRAFLESDPLGGHDPYSASKAASEMVIDCYRQSYLGSHDVAVASIRAGNVVGGGDWAEDRLVPDAVRAWSSGRPLVIRHPSAVRPWQHVLEPVTAYLRMAQRLWDEPTLAGAYNVGPDMRSPANVGDVIRAAGAAFGRGDVVVETCPDRAMPEAHYLSLDAGLAATCFGIRPRWSLDHTIARTMAWYRYHAEGKSARHLCEVDIAAFEGPE